MDFSIPKDITALLERIDAFIEAEIVPLQMPFLAINDWLGVEVVRFRERGPIA